MNGANNPLADVPELDPERFQIIERIGSGGMATVYKATQKSIGRPVAIKILSREYAQKPSGVIRSLREAHAVSRLVHPNIVSIIDFGRDPQGNILLVMELLDGESLRATLRRHGRLGVQRAVGIARQILAALRVAHAAGVVHRDLKPENVFLCRVDNKDHVKVLDFGLAKLIVGDSGDQTTAGSWVGTLKYIAPEQLMGVSADVRLDLYAVGMVLYEMLSGALPYAEQDRFKLMRSVLKEPPVPLSERAPDLPPALCELVMRAISKSPDDRFASAEEMRDALVPFARRDGSASVMAKMTQLEAQAALPSEPSTSTDGDATRIDPRAINARIGAGARATRGRGDAYRRRALLIAAGCALTAAALVTGAALRARSSSGAGSAGSGGAGASADGTAVWLRTNPAGAQVRDSATNELLGVTPCTVSVRAGQSRRVTIQLGEQSVNAVLEPGPPLDLDMHGPATPQPAPSAPAATPARRR